LKSIIPTIIGVLTMFAVRVIFDASPAEGLITYFASYIASYITINENKEAK
jgi:hypothetical protein